jgi:hypothetical protein
MTIERLGILTQKTSIIYNTIEKLALAVTCKV